MSSEVDNEAARIVGMPFRSDMLAVVKAVLLARDAAIADCRVLAEECKAHRGSSGIEVYRAKQDTDAAKLLEKYK